MAGNYIRTEEHKEAMSKKLKGRSCFWLKGKKRPPFSKEWCENMSKSKKGKMNGGKNPFYGKVH